jgi:hypothetical protein
MRARDVIRFDRVGQTRLSTRANQAARARAASRGPDPIIECQTTEPAERHTNPRFRYFSGGSG